MNRRSFVTRGGYSLLSLSPALNLASSLQLASAATLDSPPHSDYKALVCIFLFGGNDSFNMLIPADKQEYKIYRESRSDLALSLDSSNPQCALVLNGSLNGGRRFAVHPSLGPLRDLYNAGTLAFVANVGPLAEPTSITQFKNQSVRLPNALFSHNDQLEHWQTSVPDGNSATGWLGRCQDVLMTGSEGEFSAISLNGNNLLQTGKNSASYAITPRGSVGMLSGRARDLFFQLQHSSKKDSEIRGSVLGEVFADENSASIDKDIAFSGAFNRAKVPWPVEMKGSRLANSLHAVAKTIAIRSSLGATRQTFFVSAPGWDHHQDLLKNHQSKLADLGKSLAAFQRCLKSMGVDKQVTTFSVSDFGRTLRSNGRGSDHAWGGNHIVLGGAVNGGTIHGEYPEALLLGDGLDVGTNGRLLPTTSSDQYFADLLLWFGVPRNDLSIVLPNIGRFWSKDEPDSLGIFS